MAVEFLLDFKSRGFVLSQLVFPKHNYAIQFPHSHWQNHAAPEGASARILSSQKK
jgi:hypothetical protein